MASYGIREPVLSAFDKTARELFVPNQDLAYQDTALPIGFGQTISQPSLVAVTLQALRLKGSEIVLEVGTGSGFQATLLGYIARKVYSIERLEPLAKQAKQRIKALGLNNVNVTVGDGTKGWPEKAPFDAIIVAAAFTRVPEPLVEQLKEGGNLIMPIGEDNQELILYQKRDNYLVEVKKLAPVRFVPLIGEYAQTPEIN